MLPLSSLRTYSRFPLLVRLIGRIPPEVATAARLRPFEVTVKEVTVLLPALTTNSSRPFALRLTEPWVSTIGNPNGGSAAIPLPPVLTVLVWVIMPFDLRENAITALPLGLLVIV